MVVNGLRIQDNTPRIQTDYIIAHFSEIVNMYTMFYAYGKALTMARKKPENYSRALIVVVVVFGVSCCFSQCYRVPLR